MNNFDETKFVDNESIKLDSNELLLEFKFESLKIINCNTLQLKNFNHLIICLSGFFKPHILSQLLFSQ